MLEGKIKDKSAKVGVIGIGFVGLPLAICFQEAGYNVIGIDVNKDRVASVNRGESYIGDVDSSRLKGFRATDDQSVIKNLDIVSLCVPTPITKAKSPNLSFIVNESNEIAKHLHQDMLVILESTTYPGTTKDIMKPMLEQSGLKCGVDFYLAYSPEMIDPGNKVYTAKNTPKLVGGCTERCRDLACQFYNSVVDHVYAVPSPEVAELAKIYSNVFRNANVALVNEFAQLCHRMGISVWDVVDAVSKKPFGFMTFYPGTGAGGYCLPKDPYYLAEKARELNFHTRFIELAADVNENMPLYVVQSLQEAMNGRGKPIKGSSILVLGITYKKDVADTRDSPAVKVIERLLELEAKVVYNDPYIKSEVINGRVMESFKRLDLVRAFDCVLIATDHSNYDYEAIVSSAQFVYDTRNATKGLKSKNIVRLGE